MLSLNHDLTLWDPMNCSPPTFLSMKITKHIGMGCHFLHQGIFLTQVSSLHFLLWQVEFLPLIHLERPSHIHCCCSVAKLCPALSNPVNCSFPILPCPSLSPGVSSNSCLLNWWCLPTISSSVAPFSSCSQSFPPWGSFPMNGLFASGGQSIRASDSASVLQWISRTDFL